MVTSEESPNPAEACRKAPINPPSMLASRTVGVPPPKYTVSSFPMASPAARISTSSARQ